MRRTEDKRNGGLKPGDTEKKKGPQGKEGKVSDGEKIYG